MKAIFKRLLSDASGATAIEYGLILALMFLAMVSALNGFADSNLNTWNKVSSSMSDAVNNGTGG
jgi:pilus assembly protein Flp/PilA